MKTVRRRTHRLSVPMLLGCVLAIGCTGTMDAEPGPDRARIRALHLSPDAPNVDVLVDGAGEPAFADVGFTEGSRYATLDADEHTFDVTATGEPESVVLTVEASLLGAGSYTAVAFDTLEGIQPLLLEDETRDAPADLVRLRAVHTAVGIGEVDLWVLPAGGEPELLYEDVGFGQAGDVIDVPSGAHVFGIDRDDDAEPDLVFELPDLSAGTYVNLLAATDAGGAPFLLAQLPGGITARVDAEPATPEGPSEGNARVRVLHGSPDAPNVDVFVDDGTDPAFENLTFTWGTEYAELPEGSYRFRVSPNGAGAESAVIDADGVALDEGGSYTVVAYDRVADIDALVLRDDYEDAEPGTIRLRAIHTAAGVGEVDIWALDSTGAASLLYDDVTFGTAGGYVDVPAGEQTIGFDVDDDGLADAFFGVPGLTAGTVANVFALTDAEGSLFLLAQLADGNTLRIDPTEDVRETGRVRVVHLSPDAPEVDAFLNGADTPVVASLPFGSSTASTALPAGLYDVAVSAAGTTAAEAVLAVDGLSIEPDTDYTVAAYDSLAEIRALALVDDLSDPGADTIRIRAIHTGSGIGDVDVLSIPEHGVPAIVYDDLPFGETADYVELPAGAYVLGLDLDDDRVPEARYRLPHLPGGTVANVFAVADPTAVYLVAQLADGSTVRIDASH